MITHLQEEAVADGKFPDTLGAPGRLVAAGGHGHLRVGPLRVGLQIVHDLSDVGKLEKQKWKL